MGEAAQQLIASVMMNDCFTDDRAKAGHSVGEPTGNLTAMQRQVGAPHSLRHQ
jgi:hypothetical protein